MRRIALFLVLAAIPALAAAAVYRWVAPDGSVEFSDQPHPGAQKVVIPPANVYKPAQLPTPTAPAAAAPSRAPYRFFRIVAPAAGATVRSNNGDVSVALKVEPALRVARGQAFVLLLDGKRLPGRYRTPRAMLDNIDRGTHTLRAQIVNAGGKVIMATAPVTFHLMRYSRLSAPAPASGQNAAKSNPNVLDANPNVRTQNPNVRSQHPNVLSQHPNVLSPHPNVITAPK